MEGKRSRVRLNKVGQQDLSECRKFGPEGRRMHEKETVLRTHSDAANLGWGGAVSRDLRAGPDGAPLQGLWSSEDQAKAIAFREIRALRLVLESIPAPRGAAKGSAECDGLEDARVSAWAAENLLKNGAKEGCQSITETVWRRVCRVPCWVDNSAVV